MVRITLICLFIVGGYAVYKFVNEVSERGDGFIAKDLLQSKEEGFGPFDSLLGSERTVSAKSQFETLAAMFKQKVSLPEEYAGSPELTGSVAGLTLMKFGAQWCGPCRKLEAELDKLPPSLKVIRVDVDKSPAMAMKYNVSSIPHLVLLRNGRSIDDRSGYASAKQLTKWVYSNSVSINEITNVSAGDSFGSMGTVTKNPFAE